MVGYNLYMGKNKQFAVALIVLVFLFIGGYYLGSTIQSDLSGTGLMVALLFLVVGFFLYVFMYLRNTFDRVIGKVDHWYHTLVDNTPDFVVIVDPAGNIEYINKTLPNKTVEEVIGSSVFDYFKGEHKKSMQHILDQVFAQKQSISMEVRGEGPDGAQAWYSMYGFPVVEDGSVVSGMILSRDITGQKNAEQVLERSVKEKSEFVSIVAHQLRDPISIVKWNLELMQDDDQPVPESLHEVVADMQRANVFMNKLVGDLLTMSRIEEGRMPVAPAKTNFCDLVDDMVALAKNKAQEKTITIDAQLAGSCSTIIDPVLMSQVVNALLGNAIKYSPEGTTVRVKTEVQSNHIVLTVADEGIGIPAQDLPHIFEKFHRAKNAKDFSGVDGTGLGLYLSKKIVELFNGEIHVESKEGHGTTFFVSLPIQT